MIDQIEVELVLLRHGSTQWNAERRYLGHTDLSLLPSSIEQFSQLKEHPDIRRDFWRVYSSDLLRCRETLACIVPSLQDVAVYDNRLREMNFGDWEGLTYEQLKDSGPYRSWIDDPRASTPPGGESWVQFDRRVDSFLSELLQAIEDCSGTKPKGCEAAIPQYTSQRVLVVTHGGVIRQLLARTIPALTFRDAVAPPPGVIRVLKLLCRDGHWSVDPTGKDSKY